MASSIPTVPTKVQARWLTLDDYQRDHVLRKKNEIQEHSGNILSVDIIDNPFKIGLKRTPYKKVLFKKYVFNKTITYVLFDVQ